MAVTTAASLPGEIGFDAPPDVRAAVEALGRTEDVAFSPSGRRLAIAAYRNEHVALLDLELAKSGSLSVTRLEHVVSPPLGGLHGLGFLDEDTLVVAARENGVAAFRLGDAAGRSTLEQIGEAVLGTVEGPGSIVLDRARQAVLVCNDWTGTVTRHAIGPDRQLGPAEVVADKWLDLPDGIDLSHDGRWLAVSNHAFNVIFVYAYPTSGGDAAEPRAILRGNLYPHGLRFTRDDRYLVSADAGRPYLHVFAAAGDGWHGTHQPAATIRVMDDETFATGPTSPREGGPKGLDLHPRADVLAMTTECMPLACFAVDALIEQANPAEREAALREYELASIAKHDGLKGETAEAQQQLRETERRLIEVLLQNERMPTRRLANSLRGVAARLQQR